MARPNIEQSFSPRCDCLLLAALWRKRINDLIQSISNDPCRFGDLKRSPDPGVYDPCNPLLRQNLEAQFRKILVEYIFNSVCRHLEISLPFPKARARRRSRN
jgi:hypothetical protein